jgi:UPF0755 protein
MGMRRSVFIALRAAAIALGAIFLLAAALGFLNSSPARRGAPERFFAIEKGESLAGISKRLQAEGFIRFAPMLQVLGRLRRTQGAFKSGYYRIPPRATTIAIHDLLVTGAQKLVKLTIPEGWTTRKIARHLEAAGICAAVDFEAAAGSPLLAKRLGVPAQTLEGYLYPDT